MTGERIPNKPSMAQQHRKSTKLYVFSNQENSQFWSGLKFHTYVRSVVWTLMADDRRHRAQMNDKQEIIIVISIEREKNRWIHLATACRRFTYIPTCNNNIHFWIPLTKRKIIFLPLWLALLAHAHTHTIYVHTISIWHKEHSTAQSVERRQFAVAREQRNGSTAKQRNYVRPPISIKHSNGMQQRHKVNRRCDVEYFYLFMCHSFIFCRRQKRRNEI